MKRLSRISKKIPKQVRDDSFRVMLNLFQHPILLIIFVLLSSCSLKYSETVNSEDKVPEFVFEDTKMIRYEDNQPSLEVSAATLEQYKNTNESYGKDISFISYDKEGKTETEGSCGIIFADTGKKIYELYDDINVYNAPEKMRFFANVLKWDGATEQLTSGRSDMVKIEKDDTIMRGSGFSASGISKKFSFRGNITGTIETSDDKEAAGEEAPVQEENAE